MGAGQSTRKSDPVYLYYKVLEDETVQVRLYAMDVALHAKVRDIMRGKEDETFPKPTSDSNIEWLQPQDPRERPDNLVAIHAKEHVTDEVDVRVYPSRTLSELEEERKK